MDNLAIINFSIVNDPTEANLIITWVEQLYEGKVCGHANINESPTCSFAYGNFSRCEITAALSCEDMSMESIIKHRLLIISATIYLVKHKFKNK